MMTINNSKKSLHVLGDGANGVQVIDIEQATISDSFQNIIKLHKIDGFLQIFVMMLPSG